MADPTAGIPAPRTAPDDRPAAPPPGGGRPVPVEEVLGWHSPGVHRVRLADREVWVRMDGRGIAAMSTVGPERLAARPLE